MSHPLIAVLTGDVIKSGRLVKEGMDVPALLREAYRETREAFPDAGDDSGFSVFRGDSWQFVVRDAVKSLRIAVFFRAVLKSRKADSRVAVAIDTYREINPGNVSESLGNAFTQSGLLLDAMAGKGKHATLALRVADGDQDLLDIVVDLMAAFINRWTAAQALAARGAILQLPLSEIANFWNPVISQSAVSQHLDAIRWDLTENGLAFIERFVHQKLVE